MTRDYFAGKFLLIPRDDRPSSLQQPRMIAAIADHDIIAPPARDLGDTQKISAWVKTIDYGEIDGALLSLDAFAESPLEAIKFIRSQRPGIPVYVYAESVAPIDSVIDEVGPQKLIDLLVISARHQPSREWQKSFADKIASRRLLNRIILSDDPDSAASLLLVRMIDQRFGYAPRILPAYSSAAGRDAAVAGLSIPLPELISEQIKKSGGIEIRQNSEAARGVDIILFIYTANSRESDRNALLNAIAQTSEKSLRIGLVDLSGQRESGDAIIAELRKRRLIDRLSTFAAVDPANPGAGTIESAVAHAIAQASSYAAAIRFLRDDLDRVRRIDRAQIAFLLSRYLTDWAYPSQIRPRMPRGANLETAESFVIDQLKPLAEELFDDQFKRNAHSYLLSYGERADFEVRLLQRLLVRLYPNPTPASAQGFEVEIRPSVYLYYHGNELVPQLRTQKYWELSNDDMDERLGRRWNAIDWPLYKTDAQSVAMTIKVESPSAAQLDAQQSFSIISKRSHESRKLEIVAATPRGAFYALDRLEVMGADGQLGRDFQINESPAYPQRGLIESSTSWSLRDRIEMLRFLGRLRMNRYFCLQNLDAQTEMSGEKIKKLLREAVENFVQIGFGYNLPISAGERDFAAISGRLDRLSALGVRRFVIGFENDQEGPASGKIVSAQSGLIRRISEHLKGLGNFELAVWPKSLPNSVIDRDYLKELSAAIPSDIQILRPSGGTAGIRASDSSTKRPRMVFNPEEQLCLGAGSYTLTGENPSAYLIAATDQPQITRLEAARLSELAWSGASYDAGRALSSALNLLYDERSRVGVRVWLEHFGECRAGTIKGGNREQIERRLSELQTALESISGTRERGLLRGE
ncbi:MAG: DUF4127 family protein, partial [Blastocatellia bacterium]|nr:DUF4127 family protein [Blastocatellia bacterium]